MAKKKAGKSCCSMEGGHNSKCLGGMLICLGILILINAYFGLLGWGLFIGGIIAIKGIIMLIHPCCPK